MNQTLRETLTKLALETDGDWVALFPYALFRARNTPYQLSLTSLEIMHGHPTPLIPSLWSELIAPAGETDLALKDLDKSRSL